MVIPQEALALVNTFKTPLLNVLIDIKDEVKFYFEKGIYNYIEGIQEKFSKTKTFLYRLENVNFYDVYFPITLKFKENPEFEVENIEELFKKSNYISIIGSAGSGKSMLLKHIFLRTIKQIVKIPIVVELRNFNDFNGTFVEYIDYLLTGKKLTPNKKILERVLANGGFLFLLDGYDEIYSNNKNKITSDLNDFVDNYSKNYFLVTSRPGANIEALPRFDSYFVNQLNNNQVEEFIYLQLQQCDDKELANKIVSVVKKPENKDYNSYLASPLLLSMFIMTFNSYPELPKSKSKFYWNVYDTLCTKHDAFTKHGGYQHERKTGLQNEDFERILKWFSYTSLFNGKYTFDNQYFTELLKKIKTKLSLNCNLNHLIEDLTISISIIVIDGLEYKFPHKSLQEYFSALLIKEQSEEDKKEIYSNKFSKLFKHTYGGNDNFWNLCLETDTIAFKKYYLLKNLEEFIDKINFRSNEDICRSFFRYFNFSQRIEYNALAKKCKFSGYGWKGKESLSVVEYLDIGQFHNVGFIGKTPMIVKQEAIRLFDNTKTLDHNILKNKSKLYSINYENNWCANLYAFIVNTGVEKEINIFVTNVKKMITKLKREIDSHDKRKAELLEL